MEHHHHYRRRHLSPGSQPFSDRVSRAVWHRLRLLHRADPLFFVLGSSGNVYTVAVSAVPSCTCPDRGAPCKHLLFVLICVLGLPPDDPCLGRRALRPCHLSRLLARPTSAGALAGSALRERFREIFFGGGGPRPAPAPEVSGGCCPVCLEEMGREDRVVACGTCRNVIHEECFLSWKRSCRRRSATCVLCRARWRGGGDREKYLNLSAFLSEDDDVVGGEIRRCSI
ncbi:SWIM zinc finger family protein / mitogen-activated protein kinase kinase kinase (MAPKKK)-related [Striga hermonthica]|uniref:SWIM zinc finger family protein / mitogen-activated protein kinase kinase kinase (MAPKKK)-related n=1 Tax=Striga hermonthica TaxID=68872 RepID=A0A9N7NWE1_STRHE|nr:SWIM zinc finger family protein / mitogen-activated protein kinase kinase kinase (MAPKKK)-related [Striga hermonthica]